MRVIRSIFGLLLTALIAAFAVMNTEQIALTWSPFHAALGVPLYLVILVSLAAGFFLGALMTWINTVPVRLSKRKQKKKIKALEKKLEAYDTKNDAALPPSDFFPALPAREKASK